MTHKRGRRSHLAEQRRLACRLSVALGHWDARRREAVNLLEPAQLMALLGRGLEVVYPSAVVGFVRGEVLIDPRGDGSLQRGDEG